MPPNPLYGWACVAQSVAEILYHAAEIRARQVAAAGATSSLRAERSVVNQPTGARKSQAGNAEDGEQSKGALENSRYTVMKRKSPSALSVEGHSLHKEDILPHLQPFEQMPVLEGPKETTTEESSRTKGLLFSQVREEATITISKQPEPDAAAVHPSEKQNPEGQDIHPTKPQKHLRESRVPSSRFGRLVHYGGLAASMGYGAATEAFRRTSSGGESTQSSLMSAANVARLVEKLSRMRGAALKLGQFMSIQDTHLLPKDVEEVFRRVQDSAHYMPNYQMEKVMAESLGDDWKTKFASFEPIPFAAASLGQVHCATLAACVSPTGKEEKVAVKIQFPDIAKSIESDLSYLKLLLNAGRMLPRGLFLDKTLSVMKGELADECDYHKEAESARFFASNEGVGRDRRFRVPWIWQGSTERILVMENMDGVSVGGNVVDSLSQESRDQIAATIVELCMKELFELRMMQTDPNWSNFLWNEKTKQIELIDFGATRSYSKEFIDKWMHLLQSAVAEDREACIHWSRELGYLTGEESETMLDAHVRSLMLTATPFRAREDVEVDQRFAFGKGTEWSKVTGEIRSLIPVMLRERLTPPPQETYSLNRKLSGAFLLASRLSAKVDCRSIWMASVDKYTFSDGS